MGIGGNILSRLGTGCVPFLMPLMLQVGLGYPALVAGAMMAPTAIGSITAKTFAMKILNRFGYRVTLTGVTVCIGLMIAQFALQTPTLPLWMLILPLFMLGMAMSTQFTAMNSITLGDLSTEDASTGNGLLSVTQQLSISFGVASSTVLRFYNSFASGTLLDHFHYTFITIGGITMMAAFVFMLLRKDDGDSLLPGRSSSSSRRQAVPPRATPDHPR
ncbi:MAG: MFS transporter [Bilophila wadsworthia]|uniref:MFS transporter n=1 Tax=Bilophila wadsworthia TaxID=35833 RepID=UPI00300ED289